jgi:quinol monooxygenase YgiN
MAKFTCFVEVIVKPGLGDKYIGLLRNYAKAILAEEPGCLRFDVMQAIERDGTAIPDRVIINEVYADLAAYRTHGQSPRLPKLLEVSGPMTISVQTKYADLD